MSKTLKKSLSLILALVLAFSVCTTGLTAYAADDDAPVQETLDSHFRFGRTLTTVVSTVLETLIIGMLSLFPDLDWEHVNDYIPNADYKGDANFSDEVTSDVWKAGYASRSIVPDDISSGKYTSAGYFTNLPANYMDGVLDDQSFRVVALDAGDGKIALFCTIDAFGFTGTNVKALRESLADVVEGYNVVSINVSSSHSHYVLDVHGLGASLYDVLLKNVKFAFTRKPEKINSVNQDLLNNVFAQAKSAVAEALGNMHEGTLSFAAVDASDMIKDKQDPIAFDGNINQIKFVPTDSESYNEIWLVNLGVHPTTLPSSTTKVSSDYPGAIVKYAKEKAGADVAFYQGAQAAISRDTSTLDMEGLDSYDSMLKYGEEVVDRLIANETYSEIEPLLNIYQKEIFIPVTNAILHVACKFQLANNTCVKTSNRFAQNLAVSEIGYCELGKNLAIVFLPGEVSAEIVFGGTKPASIAWSGKDWKYAPIADLAGDKKVIAFGLTNDQIGYVVPDNDYANTFAEMIGGVSYFGENNKHYEELLSLGSKTASTLTTNFIDMMAEINR